MEDISERRGRRCKLRQGRKWRPSAVCGWIAHDFNNLLGGIIGYSDFVSGQIGAGSR